MSSTGPVRSRRQVIVFGVIGVGNTLFDVTLYTVLRSNGHSAVFANVVSTSAALVASYLLNSRFTFERRWSPGTFVAFLAVTLFGLEVLQTGAILVFSHFLSRIPSGDLRWLGALRSPVVLALPKLLATGISFGWNYSWYKKVIFRTRPATENVLGALD